MIKNIRSTLMVFVTTVIANQVLATEVSDPGKTRSTILLQTDNSWDGALYKKYPDGRPQLSIVRVVIPAHTTLPWHIHPLPGAAYVASGTLYVESRSGNKKATFYAGDTLSEMVDAAHRGRTGDSPVELIIFYAGVKGMKTDIEAR